MTTTMAGGGNMKADISVQNEGTIFLVRTLTEAGRAWIEENITNDEVQHFGHALVVEHRYIQDIVEGMQKDGLVVEGV